MTKYLSAPNGDKSNWLTASNNTYTFVPDLPGRYDFYLNVQLASPQYTFAYNFSNNSANGSHTVDAIPPGATINLKWYFVHVYMNVIDNTQTPSPTPSPTPTPTPSPLAQPVDFTIKTGTTNITDSDYTFDISPLTYGQSHSLKLSYTNSIANVSTITFSDNFSNTYTLNSPNTTQNVTVPGDFYGVFYQYTMTVTYIDNSKSTKTHNVTIAEISNVPSPSPKPTSTPTPTPTSTPIHSPSPSPSPLIPVAVISCSVNVGVGQQFTASLANSYSRSRGTITYWEFDYRLDSKNNPGSPTVASFNKDIATFKFMKPGAFYVRGYVKDSNNLESYFSNEIKVTISEPEPYISMSVPTFSKELRKFTVDLSGSGTTCDEYYSNFTPQAGHYVTTAPAIDWTLSNITIKTDTDFEILPSDLIYYEYWDNENTRHIGQVTNLPLSGAKKFNIMCKKQINLKITGVVSDILGHSTKPYSTTMKIIKDVKPFAELDYPKLSYRDSFNSSTGLFEAKVDIVSLSYSPDEDPLEYQHFFYRCDTDNDSDFNEESLYSIPNPNDDNHVQVIWGASQLFKYQYFVEVKELLPTASTIPEYINSSDYKMEVGYKLSTN